MAKDTKRSGKTGRFVSNSSAKRNPGTTVRESPRGGSFETVVLKSRGGKTVSVSPAAARVLRATEELRETVSKNW